ncbi:MAG: twin-arginine translocase TatA/TatE family subunit [Gammaproteobacteria bacterium]
MFSHINPISLILIISIVILLFGTNRLKTIGSDLGSAIKNFRQALEKQEDEKKE